MILIILIQFYISESLITLTLNLFTFLIFVILLFHPKFFVFATLRILLPLIIFALKISLLPIIIFLFSDFLSLKELILLNFFFLTHLVYIILLEQFEVTLIFLTLLSKIVFIYPFLLIFLIFKIKFLLFLLSLNSLNSNIQEFIIFIKIIHQIIVCYFYLLHFFFRHLHSQITNYLKLLF